MDTSMNTAVDARWQRWGLLGGVVFVVLNVVGMFAPGGPPASDAKAEEISKYFADHSDGIRLGAILFGFGVIFALWWLASLWRVIARLEPGGPRLALIVVVGVVMSGATAGVSQAMFGGVAIRESTIGGAGELVFGIGNVLFALALAPIAAQLLAVAVLTMRTKFLPAWTGWLAYLGAAACAVGVLAAGSARTSVAAFQFFGLMLWMLWILVVSVVLYTRKSS